MACIYLFSIDLEDVRDRVEGGGALRESVPEMANNYLRFLDTHQMKATFFVEGRTARRYPSLISDITLSGHEIACHTQNHTLLETLSPASFKNEIKECVDTLYQCGAKEVIGFRAPCFSLTSRTSWAYQALADLGFLYSSSVLPAQNPHHGWPEFGSKEQLIDGIYEIPITLMNLGICKIPLGGGVYFRVLPWPIIRYGFTKAQKEHSAISGYFHPYDIDSKQEKFKYPEVGHNPIMNYLMYMGRDSVFWKLEKLLDLGFCISTYKSYVLCRTEKSN